ncbi:RNA exonuclease 1 [Dendrobium catenatum]|uniref:RNA exonuclease 1 n=1 Tax=Dendrobium catenatum TaxID=906689 RepID=A0A2I0V741_9ASPA|nr:RNA exonuclease 1 [Dendrobium catenatum]
MASAFPTSDFPPLGSSAGGKAPIVPRDWSNVFAPAKDSPKAFNFSHFPEEPEVIPFSGEKLLQGGEDWKLCLVGYSIGRRPYYEALLGAIKKTWKLIGSVQLLSLSDGFFLLRFSCNEDLEMAWSRGVWFLLGKPFVLQKWHPKFKPLKEDFKTVPIWVKIHDLPLACWNSEGISRIASKIGVPIAADSLTEQKSRLTFARVCVLVDCSATYPEEIKVSLDGDVVCLKVQYEWRPFPCSHCKSLMHFSSSCPSKPEVVLNEENVEKRGRSFSRRPHNRKQSKNQQPVNLPIPNLNSPNNATSSSTSSLPLINNPAPKVTVSPNRFDALNLEEDSQSQTYVNEEYEDISVPDKADGGGDLQHYVSNKPQSKQSSPASKKTAKGKQVKKTQKQSKTK